MKKMFTLTAVSVILNMTLGGIVWWKFFKSDRSDRVDKQEFISTSRLPTESTKREPEKVFDVAMVVLQQIQAIAEIQEGFETTFRTLSGGTADLKIRIYDSKGDRTLLRSQAEAISQANYDLVFTVGAQCTQMVKEVLCKRDKKTPVVFCGVEDPVGKGIIQSEQAPGINITGVTATHDWRLQVELLTLVKKNLKRVLIVYDPTGYGGYIEQWRKQVEDIFKEKGVETKAVQVYKINEIVEKVSSFIEMADVAMILRDATLNNSLQALAKLCNRHHVTLYSSFNDSLEKGAAITFGVEEKENGILAGQHAYNILLNGANPAQMPTKSIAMRYKLLINKKAMKKQNLEVDPQIEFLMEHARVIDDAPKE